MSKVVSLYLPRRRESAVVFVVITHMLLFITKKVPKNIFTPWRNSSIHTHYSGFDLEKQPSEIIIIYLFFAFRWIKSLKTQFIAIFIINKITLTFGFFTRIQHKKGFATWICSLIAGHQYRLPGLCLKANTALRRHLAQTGPSKHNTEHRAFNPSECTEDTLVEGGPESDSPKQKSLDKPEGLHMSDPCQEVPGNVLVDNGQNYLSDSYSRDIQQHHESYHSTDELDYEGWIEKAELRIQIK